MNRTGIIIADVLTKVKNTATNGGTTTTPPPPTVATHNRLHTMDNALDHAAAVPDDYGKVPMSNDTSGVWELVDKELATFDILDDTPLSKTGSAYKHVRINSTADALEYSDQFGDATNYTEFEADGTLILHGTATVFDDLTGDITRTKTVGTRVTLNDAENTIDYTSSGTLTDYLFLNYQMSHKWKAGSTIQPHIHFDQANNNIPNFLLEYRWQRNGNTKTTAWTRLKCNTASYTYTSGTLNQIAACAGIAAPTGYGISDIIQIRVIRDTANTSTLFTGADPYTGTVSLTGVDVHYEIDSLGSHSEYTK